VYEGVYTPFPSPSTGEGNRGVGLSSV